MDPIPAQVARLLVIRKRYVGDLLLVTPVLENLRLQWPGAHLTLLCDARYARVLEGQPTLDRIWTVPDSSVPAARGAISWLGLLAKLKLARFDAVFDLNDSGSTARLTRFSSAKFRAGYTMPEKAAARARYYTHLATWTSEDHAVKHICDLHLTTLERVGVPVRTKAVRFEVPPDRQRAALDALSALAPGEAPRILFHPGAREPNRCWPVENFAALGDALQTAGLAQVLILAGPGEEERARAIASAMKTPSILLPPSDGVPGLAATLAAADLFLGNDSGPMHIAAAVGTRVIALFGAQLAFRWGPVGRKSIVLQAAVPPQVCACPFQGVCDPPNTDKMRCVSLITVQEVMAAVLAQRLAVIDLRGVRLT